MLKLMVKGHATKIRNAIKTAWVKLFAKSFFLPAYKLIYRFALSGMGVLNYENDIASGEDFFLRRVFRNATNCLVLDVGANIGKYSNKIKIISPNTTIYAFEPHEKTFELLRGESLKYGYSVFNMGCGAVEGWENLFDYEDNLGNSGHASLYKDVIEKIHLSKSACQKVRITTIDEFVKINNITKINLLKIDAEGNEFKIILGAKKTIQNEMIDMIHFEFNEMNLISRVFFRDFCEQLPQYEFYRLLPDGLMRLDPYMPLFCEIFAYQNIIAVHKGYKFLK